MNYKTTYQSPLGVLTLISENDDTLIALNYQKQMYQDAALENKATLNHDIPIFIQVKNWLDRYFKGDVVDINELNIKLYGSEFRQSVWDILKKIPYGQTMTYGEIAKTIANEKGIKTMSSQAVGGAVGHNPIAIIVPCHRVVGSKLKLTGYTGGIDKKIYLLNVEGIAYKL